MLLDENTCTCYSSNWTLKGWKINCYQSTRFSHQIKRWVGLFVHFKNTHEFWRGAYLIYRYLLIFQTANCCFSFLLKVRRQSYRYILNCETLSISKVSYLIIVIFINKVKLIWSNACINYIQAKIQTKIRCFYSEILRKPKLVALMERLIVYQMHF